MTLNAEQTTAVHSPAKRIVVIAGPGSGKSLVLIERVVHLIRECGVPPLEIVILTFTNAAAHVLVGRLREQGITVGYVGTLHGYAVRLIQRFGGLLGYRAGSVSIVTEEEQKLLLSETKKRLGSKISDKALAEFFHRQVGQSFSRGEVTGREAALIVDEYRHTLKRSNMIDYDLILVDSHKLLCSAEVRDCLKVTAMLVDEAQDSAPIDWDNYDMLPAEFEFYVGDPDQNVYSFRGASSESLVRATEDEDTETHILPVNYRSDAAICEAATKLIRYNANRIDKPVMPRDVTNRVGEVIWFQFPTDSEEIGFVYDQIRTAVTEDSYSHGEIAVLARTNAMADKCRETLRGLGVPCRFTGKIKMPEDWKFAISVISLMVDPQNDYHCEQVMKQLGRPQTEINEAKLKALRDGTSLVTAARLTSLSNATPKPSEWMVALALFGVTDESRGLIAERLKLLPNENPTLSDLLTDLWKHDTWSPHDNAAEGVFVGTVHASKGKEFDMVIIIGCEEGVLPSFQAIKFDLEADNKTIEEERRLMFVAMTRARHTLILSHAAERYAYGKKTTQTPSRFLEECR